MKMPKMRWRKSKAEPDVWYYATVGKNKVEFGKIWKRPNETEYRYDYSRGIQQFTSAFPASLSMCKKIVARHVKWMFDDMEDTP